MIAFATRYRDTFVVLWFRRYGLGVWFAIMSWIWLAGTVFRPGGGFPIDDQYLQAARRLVEGVDPWATEYPGWFAAPPISLLPMIPFAYMPFGRWVILILSVAAAVATIRRLGLPWYWLLFPPLVVAMFSGETWILFLLVVRWGWLAVLVKIYAAVPLVILGRWRELVPAAIIVLVTAPFLHWDSYIAQYPAITRHLADQAANLSAPLYLVPIAIVALILMGRARAAWMAVPALWPSTQWYYNAIALPALSPLAAALMAVPSSWCVVGACVVLAIQARLRSPGASKGGWPSLADRDVLDARSRVR